VRGQRHAPTALYPRGKTQCPLYRGLGGPRGRSGQVWKISLPPLTGFDHRTVQPVASRYTDYATRPTVALYGPFFNSSKVASLGAPYRCKQIQEYYKFNTPSILELGSNLNTSVKEWLNKISVRGSTKSHCVENWLW
jgi:hypothetical protein